MELACGGGEDAFREQAWAGGRRSRGRRWPELVGRGVAPPRARELDARRRLEGDEVEVAREAVSPPLCLGGAAPNGEEASDAVVGASRAPPRGRSARRRGARRGARRGPGGLGEFLREERVGGRLGARRRRVGRGVRRFSVRLGRAQVGRPVLGKDGVAGLMCIGPPFENTRRGHPPRRYEEGGAVGLKRPASCLTPCVRRKDNANPAVAASDD